MRITSRSWETRLMVGMFGAACMAIAFGLIGWSQGSAPRIIDGDTLEISGETIRIENLDAPEMPGRAKCKSEGDLALRARDQLAAIVREGTITLRRNAERPVDRYGRTLAVVLVDGQDVAPQMILAGVARPWRGRSSDWCGG